MWNNLQGLLQKHASSHAGPRLAIAFSGGLDSRFLAYAAKCALNDVLLLHATGPHIPTQESDYAKAWAKEQGLTLSCVPVDVLTIPQVRSNSKERCYYCKKYLMATFKQAAAGLQLCDGTNADDMKSHRPGLRALKELNILSPLAVCGFGKPTIRKIAQQKELDNAEQKARPCLLTRFNYDLTVTASVLNRIAAAELELEQAGLKDFRLRLCPEPLLQTTNTPHENIKNILEKHGFTHAEIYVNPEISGFFDRP